MPEEARKRRATKRKSSENAVLGVGVKENLTKHEVDDLMDQQTSAKAVFWSWYKT